MNMENTFEGAPSAQPAIPYGISEVDAYGEQQLYLGTANCSPSMSSPDTPYQSNAPFFQDYIPTEIYPSPEIEAESPVSDGFYNNLLPNPEVKEESLQHSVDSVVGTTPPMTSVSPETIGPETAAPAKTPAKRKRENRYKNASASVLSRRRAQNRASQRAYRERKDQRIKDLEHQLEDQIIQNRHLTMALKEARDECMHLKMRATSIGAAPLALSRAHVQANAQAHPQHQQMNPHHQRNSSDASLMSHMSQLSAASTMSVAAPSSVGPAPGTGVPMAGSFNPAANAAAMSMASHPSEMDPMYLFSQMGSTYTM